MGKNHPVITSVQNPKVQLVRALLGKPRTRHVSESFVIEGVRLVEEAVSTGWPIQQVLYSEALTERGLQIVRQLIASGIDVEQVSDHVMESLTATENSQGVLAVLQRNQLPLPNRLDLVVVADEVRDPGNLGTLIRATAAAGAQALLLTPGTTDAFAPKVLRSAMGSHFRLPIQSLDWSSIRNLLKGNLNPLTIYLAHSHQGQPLWETDMVQPCALVIGGEAEGASEPAIQIADAFVHIPMPGKTESLNAAVAAAILLFEAVRQRRR